MSKIYEVVIFTASLSKYADPLMDRLAEEPYERLFREHCTFHQGVFVKDMTKVGRPIKDVIIIDPENAIPVLSWYNNKQDRELLKMVPILEKLSKVHDVRDHIKLFVNNNRVDYGRVQRFLQAADQEQRANSQKTRKLQQVVTVQHPRLDKQAESADNRAKISNAWCEEDNKQSVSWQRNKDKGGSQQQPRQDSSRNDKPITASIHRYFDQQDKRYSGGIQGRRIIQKTQVMIPTGRIIDKNRSSSTEPAPEDNPVLSSLIYSMPQIETPTRTPRGQIKQNTGINRALDTKQESQRDFLRGYMNTRADEGSPSVYSNILRNSYSKNTPLQPKIQTQQFQANKINSNQVKLDMPVGGLQQSASMGTFTKQKYASRQSGTRPSPYREDQRSSSQERYSSNGKYQWTMQRNSTKVESPPQNHYYNIKPQRINRRTDEVLLNGNIFQKKLQEQNRKDRPVLRNKLFHQQRKQSPVVF